MKYKNIIFDLDGTLWDSRASIIDNWNEVLGKKNYLQKPLREEDMNPYMGLLADDILRDLIPGISDDELQIIQHEIAVNENTILAQRGGILYPQVENTLKELAQNHSLFIVSNCQDGYIEAFLEFFGFAYLFQDFESHGRTGQNKAANIQNVLERNKLQKNESVYVGDTQTDYESAKANELDFIFCSFGFGQLKDSLNISKLQNFSEIHSFV